MSYAPYRSAAATLALALLAACGGKSKPPPAASPLELACSVSLSGPSPVLTVVGRATTVAAAGAPAITVTLQLNPTPQTFTLGGPGWVGSTVVRGAFLTAGMSVTGQATIDGKLVAASCIGYGGLAAVSAHVNRTPTGADLSWNTVAGAVAYRWTLRDGPDGPLVASGSTTTGTTATATATLDPLKSYVVEVGAFSISGTETSFPTPLPVPKASFGRALFTAGSSGGDGVTAWQLFAPGDYSGSTLTVAYPNLLATERLAVLLVNAGGDDQGFTTVSVVGTGTPSMAPVAPPLAAMAAAGDASTSVAPADEPFDRSGARGGEALVSRWREETIARLRDGRLQRVTAALPPRGSLAAIAPAALPATRYFCQSRWSSTGIATLWRSATLALETANAAFYYTDEVKPGVDAAVAARTPLAPIGVAPFWGELAATYGTKVLPALNTYFGPESDVDGNGKMIFLLANLGKMGSSFPMGYFWPGDIELGAATASSCPSGQAGNRADMLYLLDPGNLTANLGGTGSNYLPTLNAVIAGDYPSVMAHELQHDVNYNTRFPIGGSAGVDEELWLNEGLSMLSETVAGYGLHDASGRSAVRYYQGELDPVSGLLYHRAFGLTLWEGDPRGNYAAVQAYMQYLLDHASPAVTRALENKWLTGKANVEAATGVPWEIGFARFVTAEVFSNEDTSSTAGGTIASAGNLLANSTFNYLGDGVSPDYTPWHHYTGFCTSGGTSYPKPRLAYVNYTPLASTSSVTLRRDAWAAFATGAGSGGASTITVQSSATVRPHVVVVKYTGTLPNFTPLDTTCP